MTYPEALEALTERLEEATNETLKEAVTIINDDLSIDNIAFELGLGLLEDRLPEVEFVDFCEELFEAN